MEVLLLGFPEKCQACLIDALENISFVSIFYLLN